MQRLLTSLAICLFFTASSHAERFTFVALGDTAYDEARDQPIYEALIETINQSKPAFTIHVGDVWGLNHCGNAEIQEVLETFKRFDHSLVYTPGDNEWTDCHFRLAGAFDPAKRLARLREEFFSEPVTLGARPMPLISQRRISPYATYAENVRWQKHGGLQAHNRKGRSRICGHWRTCGGTSRSPCAAPRLPSAEPIQKRRTAP